MRKLFSCVITVFVSYCLLGYEVAFTNNVTGIPSGWQMLGDGTVSVSGTRQDPGKEETGLCFSFVTARGVNVFGTAVPVIPHSKILCDNVYARIRVYQQKENFKIDTFQLVVSTNNWSNYPDSNSFIKVGDPIPLEENGRTTAEWVTFLRGVQIPGLSVLGNDVSVGILAGAAGSSGRLGYLQSIDLKFVAVATPQNVSFEVDGNVVSSLEPSEANAVVVANINEYPSDGDAKVTVSNVKWVLDRNGVVTTNNMTRVGSSTRWESGVISPAIEAGESLKASVLTEYTSSIDTLGDKDALGIAREQSDWVNIEGTKKGSVWINEFTLDQIELCGTTNRKIERTGWRLELSDGNGTISQADLDGTFDFETNMINGVVGLEMRELVWKNPATGEIREFEPGDYNLRLRNPAGVVEHEVSIVLPVSGSFGMVGCAVWKGYEYDWAGTATNDNVFTWLEQTNCSFGKVNEGQGFKVPISAKLMVNTETDSGTPLSYVTVIATGSNILNTTDAAAITNFPPVQSEDGVASINISGYSANPEKINVELAANAFGWVGLPEVLEVSNGTEEEAVLQLTPTIATDDFDGGSLKSFWGKAAESSLNWQIAKQDGRDVLRLNSMSSPKGSAILGCANFLSPLGRKCASVSFDYMNWKSSSLRHDYFKVMLTTNGNWKGEVVATPVLVNNLPHRMGDKGWYRYQTVFELPEGFAQSDEIWVRLVCDSDGSTMSYTTIDNLRIAFQDVVLPTNLVRSATVPASGESLAFLLDVLPQTTGTVADVSADLHLVLNGVTNVVPFAFADGSLTKALSLVDGEAVAVPMTITAEALENALGRPFLTGDQVTYFAAVHYNSDNGDTDPEKVRETRFFPDNSTTSNEYWIVEGDYGVNADLSAETFAVTGDALSCFGTPEVTTEGFGFRLHGYAENGISRLTVNVNGTDYQPFEGLETNAQIRVTGRFELPTGLEDSHAYTITITATDVNGESLTPATFEIVTLPKVPTAKIEAVSPTEVKLTATGNAAGFVVSPAGWTQQSVNTWTRNDGTPNQQFQASVYATNKVGAASAPAAATPGYTKSAVATKVPVAEKGRNTITVKAGADYTVANDGNPEGTEYALGISTNGVDWVILSDDDGEIWKTLPDWQEHSETLSAPTINLNTTNNFKFVTRNFDGVVSAETAAVAKCWFDMEAYHVDGRLAQVANPFGTVKFDMELVDAAKSADAAVVIEYKIGNGAWKSAGAAVPVVFNELTITNSFSWDAWTAVGQAVGNYEYALRAKVKSDSSHRSSEWAQISGVLDFTPPTELAITGTPTNGAITKSKNYTLAFSANDANEIAYTWTLDGVDGDGNELAGAVDDGVHMLKVRATDSMGNFSEATQTWTVDTQMPTNLAIAGTPEANAVTKATSFAFTASATDATALKYCWTLNGVAASTTSATYSGTAAEGTNTVSVYVVDAAGNRSATVKRTWVRDTTAPTVPVISGTPANGALTNSKAVNFTVQSTDATALTYHWSFKGADSTGTKLVGEGVEGANSVSVYATDAAGNRSTTTTRSWTVDTLAPTVALTSSTPNPFNAAKAPMVVTATFSEEVKNFTAASVTVVNGMVSAVSGSGAVYTVSITPKADGPVTVSIAANAVTDNAGNKNAASSTLTRTYDATKPTVTLTSTTPAMFNANDTFTVAVKFSETVKNFTAASVTVGNGTVSAVSGSGKDYTLTITPKADGEVSVQIGAGKVTDEAGNGNAASSVLKRQCDTTKPTVALASSTPNPFNATKSPMQVTVTFSEPVTNFTASSVSVGNGRVTGVSGSAAAYTMTVNPTADGPVSVSVAAGVVADAAGNGNTASSTLTRTYDVTPPMVELSSETSERFNEAAAPMTVKVVFNEPVTNFTAASVTVLNGTVGSVAEAEDAENTYLVDINPTADGTVSVSVGASVVADAAGNGNVSSQALARIYDNVKPTVALTSETPGSFNGAAAPLTVKVVFSESVTNFTASAVTVVNGTVDAVVEAEDVENAYLVNVTPTADGTVSVSVGAGVVADAAGNGNEASNELKRLYDNVQPTAELSSETPQLFNANDVFTVKVVFSEAVTNFTAVSVAVVNGTVAEVVEVEDEDNAYLVTVNPTADGQVTVSIPGGVVADEAGNGNAVSESLMRTCDKTRPTVKITTTMQMNVAFSASTLEQDPFVAKVEFSEPVTGFAASSVTIVNGTIKGTMSNVGSNTYRFEVSPSAEGPVIISIAEGVVSDSAGNLNEASTSLTRVYDNVPPTTPVITGSPENGTTTGSRTFALTARSEDASGIVYFWFVNGEPVSGSYGNELTGLAKEGLNEVEVYAIDDADNLSSSAFWTWIYDAGSASGDVEFGGGVCVKVDPDTGATNSVAFTMVDFNPDSTSTLTMSGFSATTQELTDFQLWLVVGSLDGARWHVKVDDHANFNAEKGELTVTLPAKALKKQDGSEYEQLFIFGIDNQNSPE